MSGGATMWMVELTSYLGVRVLGGETPLDGLSSDVTAVYVVEGVPKDRVLGAVVAKLAGTLSPLVRVDMILGTLRRGK